MELRHQAHTYEVREVAPRTLRFTGSDETYDRYKTVILVDGWKLENYRKSPVFCWSHDPAEIRNILGQTVNIQTETTTRGGKASKRLVFDVLFASKEANPYAEFAYRLYKEGALRAVSVGFKNLSTREATDEERGAFGIPEGEHATILDQNELFELSAVAIPGNPNAVIDQLSAYDESVRSVKPEEIDEAWLALKLEKIREQFADEAVKVNGQPAWQWFTSGGDIATTLAIDTHRIFHMCDCDAAVELLQKQVTELEARILAIQLQLRSKAEYPPVNPKSKYDTLIDDILSIQRKGNQ